MKIGLASWIIQDGNYPDFDVGQQVCFALRFEPHDLPKGAIAASSSYSEDSAFYRRSGRVLFVAPKAWVVDFGFLAYSNAHPPTPVSIGSVIENTFFLSVDPFFYTEEFSRIRGMPEIRYDWRIDSIVLETTPLIQSVDDTGQVIHQRDSSRTKRVKVPRTNANEDDVDGDAHYLLDCTCIGLRS